MRVAERSAPQLPPPGGNGDKPEESEPPRKRGREASTSSGPVSGSTEELPPGTDEAGMGAEQDQEAPGTPQGPKPTVPETRGMKRQSDGDDDDRQFDREDDDGPEAASSASGSGAGIPCTNSGVQPGATRSSVAQPAQSPTAETRDISMDGLNTGHRDRRHDAGEKAAKESLEIEGRLRDMAVVRKKLGCKNDVSEVYSPPRIVTAAEAVSEVASA